MGRRGVSREAVEEAREALVAAGLAPSVRTVREKIGHTGSLTTIAGHLRAIEAERAEGPGPALPDALVRGLVEGASAFWADLASAADSLVDDVRESATAEIASMVAERDAALERAARAGEELGGTRATIHSLERHLDETSARVERLEGQLDEARAQTRAIEVAGQAWHGERDALARELAALGARAEAERAAAQDRQAEQTEQVEALRAELQEVQAARAEERRAVQARLDERDTALTELRTALARAEEHAVRLEAHGSERTAERDAARGDLADLRERVNALVAERDALSAERTALVRDARASELLERLVDDDHSTRVLALLESIGERVGGNIR